MSDIYVTYGLGNIFQKNKCNINLQCNYNGKPKSGWWGSPIDTEFGWKDWCMSEKWLPGMCSRTEQQKFEEDAEKYFSDNNKITWRLKDGSKKIDIITEKDIKELVNSGYIKNIPGGRFYDTYIIDFEKIKRAGYSAVELFTPVFGHGCTNLDIGIESLFYSWDCQSIVVLDPDVICQINI